MVIRPSISFLITLCIIASVGTVAAQTPEFSSLNSGFLRNDGQWNAAARFRARISSLNLWVEKDGATIQSEGPVVEPDIHDSTFRFTDEMMHIRGSAFRITIEDARTRALLPQGNRGCRTSFFIGNDPAAWRTDIESFDRVVLQGVRPDIDLVFLERDGRLAYDIEAGARADIAGMVFVVDGADSMFIDVDGCLRMRNTYGELVHSRPIAWEERGTERVMRKVEFRIIDGRRFGLRCDDWSRTGRLVVDPGITWGYYLGGTASDRTAHRALEHDSAGNAYLAGHTFSTNFPTTVGAYDVTAGPGTGSYYDGWAARFSPTGQLTWSSYFGGSLGEVNYGLVLDAAGIITIGGQSQGGTFPVLNAYDATYGGPAGAGYGDGTVIRFDPALTGTAQFLYATFVGGSGEDIIYSVDAEASGAIAFSGMTQSTSPSLAVTPGAFQSVNAGGWDMLIGRLNLAAVGSIQMTFMTLCGGNSSDDGYSVKVDALGRYVVCGRTTSSSFPATGNASDGTFGGLADGVMTVFDPSAAGTTQMTYGSFLGGPGADAIRGVELLPNGMWVVAGFHDDGLSTTPGAFQPVASVGNYDAFVAAVDATLPPGSQVIGGTYFGGGGVEQFNDFDVDGSGVVTLTGWIGGGMISTTTGSLSPLPASPNDGIVARFSPDFTRLIYATYVGGNAIEEIRNIDVLDDGAVRIAGFSASTNLVASNLPPANDNVYLAELDLLPTGVVRFGAPTSGCTTPKIDASTLPVVGSTAFSFIGSQAPATTSGLLAASLFRMPSAVTNYGVDVWIDPTFLYQLIPVTADARGYCELPTAIPSIPTLAGFSTSVQFFWLDGCNPQFLSASAALEVTIQ